MNYKAIERHERNIAYHWVKETNLKMLHIAWFQLYNTEEDKAMQTLKRTVISWDGAGGMNRQSTDDFLGQWKYLVYYSDIYMSPYICPNS